MSNIQNNESSSSEIDLCALQAQVELTSRRKKSYHL